MESEQLLKYLKQGINQLLEQGCFDGDQEFRKTQRQALEAYKKYLNQNKISTEQKLKGFFEIPTGVGKTAVFVGIVAAAHSAAEQDGKELKTAIVVPTTQLMYQTQESFQGNDKDPKDPDYFSGFAPNLKGQIGFFGDGKKNLKLPITIMTYDAWYDLSQSGKIGSHNIDILISDEAHRGTSERRIENITGAFNENTIQLAFTATAHFDETKSVEASHERRIFYKSLPESMKDKELAAYIESQRAIIRIEPDEFMLSDEFNASSREERTAHRKKLRLKAWNKFALKTFREGRDTRRGHLLSDNQAGFFVEGIDQANQLEKMLNADPELQKRAHDQGRKGVAVAIHSKLSPKEQLRRFKAYKNGKYMAVVGDEKFKEGFDHSPMKTIIDCPHSSLVDKAQIIGRGARRWFNRLKHRFEGMTIIDTAMYFGSKDKEENKLLRDKALTKGIYTKDILGGSYILGPEAPKGKSKGGGGSNIFVDDPNVEYYAEIDEINLFDGELFQARENALTRGELLDLIPITDAMREDLKSEVERTGVAVSTFASRTNRTFKNVTSQVLYSWLTGSVVSADEEDWNGVLAGYAELPTGDKKIKITPSMRDKLIAESDRTKVGGIRLVKQFELPDGVTGGMIHNWYKGKSKNALRKHWSKVMEAYATLPTFLKVTPEMRKQLTDTMERSGIYQVALLKQAQDVPEGLTAKTIESCRNGATANIKEEHWNWVINTYATMPKRLSITKNMVDGLKSEMKRTGLKAQAFMSQAQGMPEHINDSLLNSWVRAGGTKTCTEADWTTIIEAYKALPDHNAQPSTSNHDDFEP